MRSSARFFIELDARLLLGGQRETRQRIGHVRRLEGLEHLLGGDLRHVGVVLLDGVHPLLDFAHGVDVFHQALFATVADDQALDARSDGNLGLLGDQVLDVHARHQFARR